MTRIVVHGHFYQPPREDPWTGRIERQPSAAPFRDWNERIHAECYRPNAFASVPTEIGELTVNNFERLSFDVGPTLMAWLERAHPETYARIVEADRKSEARLGEGSAIAQAFHHTILPLSNPRDVRTEIRWGLADFRYRFSRPARGIWLPETAVNDDVLSILIEEEVEFTILAPHQAGRWRAEPDGEWNDAAKHPIDPRLPYRYLHRDGSGRSVTIFFFDATIARAIAFENAAASAIGFLHLFQARGGEEGAVGTATDGETYGHHFRFADLGLAYALFVEADRHKIEPVNYGVMLSEATEREVTLVPGEGTSWSCEHGVGRWTRECGCSTGGEPGWNQAWREPLRQALDLIRHAADEAFERLGASLLRDVWAARDDYVDVVIGKRPIEEFLAAHASGPMGEAEAAQATTLLEMQRNALAMYTSCGWFFSDIAGIESQQILRYAARALELMESLGQPTPAAAVTSKLEEAKSNVPDEGTGADIFARLTG